MIVCIMIYHMMLLSSPNMHYSILYVTCFPCLPCHTLHSLPLTSPSLSQMQAALAGADGDQVAMMEEKVILVNEQDEVIGAESKKVSM